MDSFIVAGISFLGMFGGCVAAIYLARSLKEHHVSKGTQDTVKLGVGMIAAMTSLILGLMTASVKGNFDSTDKDVHTYALNILSLDTDFRHYGSQACPARTLLLGYASAVVSETWGKDPRLPPLPDNSRSDDLLLAIETSVRSWSPATDDQKETRSDALSDLRSILSTRWTVSEEAVTSVPTVFVVVLVVWLSLIFVSFGLFAPPNAVVIGSFFLCAASIAGALFLIMEMSGPFDGVISVSSQPMVQVIDFMRGHPCQ